MVEIPSIHSVEQYCKLLGYDAKVIAEKSFKKPFNVHRAIIAISKSNIDLLEAVKVKKNVDKVCRYSGAVCRHSGALLKPLLIDLFMPYLGFNLVLGSCRNISLKLV